MNHSAPEEQIDAWLRSRHEPDLPDNGFTLRVLKSLPSKKQPFLAQRRAWLIFGGFIAGSAIAWRHGAAASLDWQAAARSLEDISRNTAALAGNTSLSAVLILVLVSLGIAYWQSLTRLLRP